MTGAEVQTVTELINWERVTVIGLLLTFIWGLKAKWWVMGWTYEALVKINEDQTALIYELAGVTAKSVDSAKVVVMGRKPARKLES